MGAEPLSYLQLHLCSPSMFFFFWEGPSGWFHRVGALVFWGAAFEMTPAGCSHPKEPEHLLKHGELQQVFGSMDILRDEDWAGKDSREISPWFQKTRSIL